MAAQKKDSSTLKKEPEKKLKTLMHWSAPSRLFKKRSRDYFTTIGAIVFLLIIILVFLKEWLLIGVVVSLMFLAYVMATVEPETTEHVLTNVGIETGGKSYAWDELKKFWVTEKWQWSMIHIEIKEGYPGRLILLAPKDKTQEIKVVLNDYLAMETPEPGFIDKAADWLQEKVPLEESS